MSRHSRETPLRSPLPSRSRSRRSRSNGRGRAGAPLFTPPLWPTAQPRSQQRTARKTRPFRTRSTSLVPDAKNERRNRGRSITSDETGLLGPSSAGSSVDPVELLRSHSDGDGYDDEHESPCNKHGDQAGCGTHGSTSYVAGATRDDRFPRHWTRGAVMSRGFDLLEEEPQPGLRGRGTSVGMFCPVSRLASAWHDHSESIPALAAELLAHSASPDRNGSTASFLKS